MTDLTQMQAEIDRLRATVAALEQRDETRSSRRRMLRLAGVAAAAGAAGAIGSSGRAAATDDETVQIGWSHPGTRMTSFGVGAGAKAVNGPGSGVLFRVDNQTGQAAAGAIGLEVLGTGTGVNAISTVGRAVLGAGGTHGVVGQASNGVGVFGTGSTFGAVANATGAGVGLATSSPSNTAIIANGVTGVDATGTTGPGVLGTSASGSGVAGVSTAGAGVVGAGAIGVGGTSTTGAGVAGQGVIGVSGIGSTGSGVSGTSASGSGVTGTSTGAAGMAAIGGTDGVRAVGGAGPTTAGVNASGVYGVMVSSASKAALLLSPATVTPPALRPPPNQRTDAHIVGEIDIDANAGLWYCVASGSPGTWRKLAGPTTAGAFHAITPSRVYDSRSAAPTPGALVAGSTRDIGIASARSLDSGAVTVADLVPAGATAIACNVTVVNTVLAGFLTLNPGGNATVSAATVNWSAPGQILNNGVIVAINPATRQVTAIAGGSPGAQTDFVIDVTGYFA